MGRPEGVDRPPLLQGLMERDQEPQGRVPPASADQQPDLGLGCPDGRVDDPGGDPLVTLLEDGVGDPAADAARVAERPGPLRPHVRDLVHLDRGTLGLRLSVLVQPRGRVGVGAVPSAMLLDHLGQPLTDPCVPAWRPVVAFIGGVAVVVGIV